jgi:hypothetical protein
VLPPVAKLGDIRRNPPRLMVCRGSQRRIEYDLFVVFGASIIAVDAMNIEMASQAEADEEILTFDIPDLCWSELGLAEQTAFTVRRNQTSRGPCDAASHNECGLVTASVSCNSSKISNRIAAAWNADTQQGTHGSRGALLNGGHSKRKSETQRPLPHGA